MNDDALPTSPSLVGAILSRRFRLTRLLGQGGMGGVYATDQFQGDVPLAVKILHPEFVADLHVLARFVEEGTASQRLVHPNILRVFECATAEDGSPYIVMELLEGVPLGAYTKNGGRVPFAQAVTIVQGILQGLGAAHASGIVHRDLKPENVFLSRDRAGQFVIKLLDFGIAKVMDAAGGMGNKTRTGAILGTPAYMSPEQVKNSKDVDGRADLWSAGVMFYEMLTGTRAFPAPTAYARLHAVVTTEPRAIGEIDPALAHLGPFFERALKKDRRDRFQSTNEMMQALNALAHPTTSAPVAGDLPLGAMKAGPDGTLTSAPQAPIADVVPQVSIVPTARESAASRSVLVWIVACLVVLALALGFALGYFVRGS